MELLVFVLILLLTNLKRLIGKVTYKINEGAVVFLTAYLRWFSENSFTYLSLSLVSVKTLVVFLKQSNLELV